MVEAIPPVPPAAVMTPTRPPLPKTPPPPPPTVPPPPPALSPLQTSPPAEAIAPPPPSPPTVNRQVATLPPPSPPPSPKPEESIAPHAPDSAPTLRAPGPATEMAARPPPAAGVAAVPQPVMRSAPGAPLQGEAGGVSPPGAGSQQRDPVTTLAPPQPQSLGGPGGAPSGAGGTIGARAIYKPLPEIPEALRHRTLEVVAVARFKVDANGTAQVELIEPTSDPDLNRALVESLRRWRFSPSKQDGKPVPSTIDLRIPISVK
jgi:periplasmic protein TonB